MLGSAIQPSEIEPSPIRSIDFEGKTARQSSMDGLLDCSLRSRSLYQSAELGVIFVIENQARWSKMKTLNKGCRQHTVVSQSLSRHHIRLDLGASD